MNTVVIAARVTMTLLLATATATAAEAPVPDSQLVTAAWQAHKSRINYFGITAHYTCSGLEDHVRDILVQLGARKDARVHASGCPGGPNSPSPTAWVDADFHTLAPADSQPGVAVVQAYWAPRELGPRRPYFMGEGDCELIDQMKELISGSFALQRLEYRTDCVPHQISINGFLVKANALVAAPQAKAGVVKP